MKPDGQVTRPPAATRLRRLLGGRTIAMGASDELHAACDEIERLRVLLHRCLCNLDTDYHAPLIKDINDAGVSHTCGGTQALLEIPMPSDQTGAMMMTATDVRDRQRQADAALAEYARDKIRYAVAIEAVNAVVALAAGMATIEIRALIEDIRDAR